MGLRDRMNAHAERQVASEEVAVESVAGCPDPRSHYKTEVNKGSINMTMFGAGLNVQYAKGYRLAHVYSIDGNTVQVFEHNHP